MSLFDEALKDPKFRKLYEEEKEKLDRELSLEDEKRGMERAAQIVEKRAGKAGYSNEGVERRLAVQIRMAAKELK